MPLLFDHSSARQRNVFLVCRDFVCVEQNNFGTRKQMKRMNEGEKKKKPPTKFIWTNGNRIQCTSFWFRAVALYIPLHIHIDWGNSLINTSGCRKYNVTEPDMIIIFSFSSFIHKVSCAGKEVTSWCGETETATTIDFTFKNKRHGCCYSFASFFSPPIFLFSSSSLF